MKFFFLILLCALCVAFISTLIQKIPARSSWGSVAALSGCLIVASCIAGTAGVTLIGIPSGDPSATVVHFFDAVKADDYTLAATYLNNCSSLGYRESTDSSAELLSRAMVDAFSYELQGESLNSGLTAQQQVVIRYLDLRGLTEGLDDTVDAVLETLVDRTDSDFVYDSNNGYQPDFIADVYQSSLQVCLDSKDDYLVQKVITVSLVYVSGQWMIQPDNTLFNCILGGVYE